MPTIRTYLKSGQVIETVGRVKITTSAGQLSCADWSDITSGERVVYADANDIAAITQIIEPKSAK